MFLLLKMYIYLNIFIKLTERLDEDLKRFMLLELEASARKVFVQFSFPWSEKYLLQLTPFLTTTSSDHPSQIVADKVNSNLQ